MALLAVRWERVRLVAAAGERGAASAPRLPLLPSARGSLRSERRPLPPPPRLTTHDCKDCSAGTRRGAAVLSAPRSAHLPSSLRLRAQFRCLPARRKKEPQRLSLRNKRPILLWRRPVATTRTALREQWDSVPSTTGYIGPLDVPVDCFCLVRPRKRRRGEASGCKQLDQWLESRISENGLFPLVLT